MKSWLMCLPLSLAMAWSVAASAAEIGAVTLLEGGPVHLLRGATWYKLVVGARLEEADILDVPERTQMQIEVPGGTIVNFVGAGTIYFTPAPPKTKGGPLTLSLSSGWLKLLAKPPGLRLHTAAFDLVAAEGIVPFHAGSPTVDFFVESGSGRLIELTPAGADGPTRDVKAGEYWAKGTVGGFTSVPRAPQAFVSAMPKHFVDPLPTLIARLKAKPTLVVDHEITYAEAEPWLAGRDRAVFEKRFVGRLKDPVFRSAALPNVPRYPMWDRIIYPEKYLPKTPPASATKTAPADTAKATPSASPPKAAAPAK